MQAWWPQAGLGNAAAHRAAARANERWSLNIVSDAFTDGRRFRVLAVVDDFTRECLALVADTSLSGLRVTRELDIVMTQHGRPRTIVSENGTDLDGNPQMAPSDTCRMALHRTRQADAERLRGKLQRQLP